MVAGLAMRYGLHANPHSLMLYIVQTLFTMVLAPCAFIASAYVLLGRIAIYLDCDEQLVISPRILTRVFLISDISTFLIQAAGGGLSASSSKSGGSVDLGSKVSLVGVILQLVSFGIFTGIYIVFLYRVYTRRRTIWTIDRYRGFYNDWRGLALALAISCAGILVSLLSEHLQARIITRVIVRSVRSTGQ
ncbi:hypothetical protein HGRIS_004850 [Hohenbuehelia grisea]|uniref:Uncharacterized protein n=1 Tax=Hohenbuehelia grisea TaxID=104357 RepID=A0ABR3JDL9_9AGAR